jgi:hypothetical protein
MQTWRGWEDGAIMEKKLSKTAKEVNLSLTPVDNV